MCVKSEVTMNIILGLIIKNVTEQMPAKMRYRSQYLNI